MMKVIFNKFFLQVLAILVLINVIASFFNWSIDLTADKRYTLTNATKDIVRKEDDIVNVKAYLGGELPAGLENLKVSAYEMVERFSRLNNNIVFEALDPDEGSPEAAKANKEQLIKDGFTPTSLKVFDGTTYQQKEIFPYVVFQIGQRKSVVNLLEPQSPGQDEQEILEQSVSLLEYKFANALQKLQIERKKNIVFLSGHGELPLQNTVVLEKELRKWYNTGRINLDSVIKLDAAIDLLIIAEPTIAYDDQSKFKIDQYIMNGGKVIWLMEKLTASLDSIAKFEFYIPSDVDAGLDDLLFKYGVKIQPNLILDLESTQIPQVVGQSGGKPQTMMFNWPYHLLVAPKVDHPIVKNIDRVNMHFASQIDTVKTMGSVSKTILLSSSSYSKVQFNPMRLNFQILQQQPDPRQFSQKNIPVAVLLEGSFESAYKNKLTSDFQNTLAQIKQPFMPASKPTKQIVISDADFAKNLINMRTQEPEEIGFNKWEIKYFKGNKDFILNSVEYLLDEYNILSARSKEIKFRPLDKVKTQNEKLTWQLINVLLPLIILGIFAFVFLYIRKRKYAQ